MIMKSDINKLVCILFVHLSSTSLENFEDRSLINPEILELIKLHTYKFGLVYILFHQYFPVFHDFVYNKIVYGTGRHLSKTCFLFWVKLFLLCMLYQT